MRGPKITQSPRSSIFSSLEAPALADFWSLGDAERDELLLHGIAGSHAYHYERNTGYRNTVAARGVGPRVHPVELPRLLRATSHAFKSYVDILGTPFPQDEANGFVEWLSEQVSVDLRLKEHHFRSRYRSLESLLRAIERAYSRFGLEMLTSSGTTGRTTIIPRDRVGTALAVESFCLSFERYLGLKPEYTAIFMMPKRTRIATERMTRFGVERIGLPPEGVHFAVRFSTNPDRLRLRAGRTLRTGWRGAFEKEVSHPVRAFLHRKIVDAQAVESAISRLIPAGAHDEQVLLFGGLVQLHALASFLLEGGRTMTLAPGSLLVTTGGMTKAYVKTPGEIREDLRRAFTLSNGEPIPIRDVYSLAEANWAAVQCSHGNYHVPPWIHAVALDDEEAFQKEARSTGLLAFFDPYGGGELFPAFFRTADRVTLVRGTTCACGDPGNYLEEASIRPVDVLGEAGCGGHV